METADLRYGDANRRSDVHDFGSMTWVSGLQLQVKPGRQNGRG